MTDSPRRLESSDCHCINLRRAASAVTDYYDRMLSGAGVTLSQYSLLGNIRRIEPCSVADLARQMRLDRTTLVRNLKALYAAEWIRDEASPGSRRSRIRLTESGLAKAQEAKACWRRAQEDIEALLGADGLQSLTGYLLALEQMHAQITE